MQPIRRLVAVVTVPLALAACGDEAVAPIHEQLSPSSSFDQDTEQATASAESLWVSCPKNQLLVGEAMQCFAVSFPSGQVLIPGANGPFWSSANSSVASVSWAGQVSGVAAGSTVVSVLYNGKVSIATVRVVAPPPAVTPPPPLSANIDGINYVEVEGTYTYTAQPAGASGPYSYQWYIVWPNQWPGWIELGTGVTQDVSVYAGYGNFNLAVRVSTSDYVAEGFTSVQNAIGCGGPIACR